MKEKEKEVTINITAEPKMRSRFIFNFPKELGIESWMIQKTNLPIYRFGRKKWDDIKVEFIDTIVPSVGEKLNAMVRGKRKRLEISIDVLDPTGAVIETWYFCQNPLSNCSL